MSWCRADVTGRDTRSQVCGDDVVTVCVSRELIAVNGAAID